MANIDFEKHNEFVQFFSQQAYQQVKDKIQLLSGIQTPFRIAETPVFLDKAVMDEMIDTCEYIIDQTLHPKFIQLTENAIPPSIRFQGEEPYPAFLCFDFALTSETNSSLGVKLIEMQAFPTLFGLVWALEQAHREAYPITPEWKSFFTLINKEAYATTLATTILGNHQPKEVILLEIEPDKQKTFIDFKLIQRLTKIPIICIKELLIENNNVFYISDKNEKVQVKRIFNRIIFDEWNDHPEHHLFPNLWQNLEVEWHPHPHWFYRLSKYALPLLSHKNIPSSFYANEITPSHSLSNAVVKPMFSFAGKGVNLSPTWEDIIQLSDRNQWLVQEKVKYASCIPTPTGNTKAEIRIFYWQPAPNSRPEPIGNIVRLAREEMMNVGFHQAQEWVGASIAYFR